MNKKLFVGGMLPYDTDADDLRKMFSAFGTVAHVEIPIHPTLKSPMGFAFVEMSRGAEKAIKALDGTKYRGHDFRVNEADTQPDIQDPFYVIMSRLGNHNKEPENAAYRDALLDLQKLAVSGDADAAIELANILAMDGPHFAPESAYKWYYVGYALYGDLIEFNDQNHTPPSYGGPVGDFRNESMVSGVVSLLGFEKVRALDAEAAEWMAKHGIKP